MTIRRAFLAGAAFLCLSAARPAAAAPPSAEDLLDMILAAPDTPFQGRVMIARWNGPRSRAEEAAVYFRPPNSYRWEFLGPDGRPQRVVVSDGRRQEVSIAGRAQPLVGDAAKSRSKVMSADRERLLLSSNYAPTVLAADRVAGRPVWVLSLAPVLEGKPEQRFWVDQETEVVLEVKRSLPGGAFAASSLFTRFDPDPSPELNDALFKTTYGSGGAVASRVMAPAFMTLEELERRAGGSFRVPPELPEGFFFESADSFQVAGRAVFQVRYTDGLAVLSLFRTDRPTRAPPEDVLSSASGDVPSIRLHAQTASLQWKKGGYFYTLVGDLSPALLGRVSKHFQ
jgi:negative regulator of sigma E activity